MQELHNNWFPIRYPQAFFDTATTLPSVYHSECMADRNGELAAILVAKNIRVCSCDREDRDILPPSRAVRHGGVDERLVTYILTVGVENRFRRKRIGAYLIRNLVQKAMSHPHKIHAIYLHVLVSNAAAIRFYEKIGFVQHKLLEGYYIIGNNTYDAYCYILRLDDDDVQECEACLDRCHIS